MTLIETLSEKLPEQSRIYNRIKSSPALSKPLKEAAGLIDQALEDYNPQAYYNEASEKALNQAKEMLESLDKPLKEAACYLLEGYVYSLLSGIEMNRGEWDLAQSYIKKALEKTDKANEKEETALCLSLLAALELQQALIFDSQFQLREALDYYGKSIESYQKALEMNQEDLQAELIHGLQRVLKDRGDLYANELATSQAIKDYVKIIELGQAPSSSSFYDVLISFFPQMAGFFDNAVAVDLDNPKQSQHSYPIVKWLALLELDHPSIEEVCEIFNFHFAIVNGYMQSERARKKLTWRTLDNLMIILEKFLESKLYQQIVSNSTQTDFIEDPKHLLDSLAERYMKTKRAIIDKKEVKEPAFDFTTSPREKELLYQYQHNLEMADDYFIEVESQKEKEALDKCLLYAIALNHQANNPINREAYQVMVYEMYERLGEYYYQHREDKKAIEFLEKAISFGEELYLEEEFGYQPQDLASPYHLLTELMERNDQPEKEKIYRQKADDYDAQQAEYEQEMAEWDEAFEMAELDDFDNEPKDLEEILSGKHLIERFKQMQEELENSQDDQEED